jgi:hypothetical protein
MYDKKLYGEVWCMKWLAPAIHHTSYIILLNNDFHKFVTPRIWFEATQSYYIVKSGRIGIATI